MDKALLEQLIALVGRAPIDELEYARDGWSMRISKANGTPVTSTSQDATLVPTASPATQARQDAKTASPTGHDIRAPLVGAFYRSPSPGEAPFVSVGDQVEEGQTLGILEAMKTMNAIEADRAGQISAVLQEDGASVMSGTPLFTIVPSL